MRKKIVGLEYVDATKFTFDVSEQGNKDIKLIHSSEKLTQGVNIIVISLKI